MKILRHYCIGKKRIAKFLEKYKVPYSKLYNADDEYLSLIHISEPTRH